MAILGGILGDLLDPIKDLVSEVVVDKDKRNELNYKIKELEDKVNERLHEQMIAQVDVNKVEASNSSVFVAGWRPFVGWVGGFGLIYSTILQPLLNWVSRVAGYTGSLPALDDTSLVTVLIGMLGIGAMRSFDRMQGTATDNFTTNPPTAEAAPDVETAPEKPSKRRKTFGIF